LTGAPGPRGNPGEPGISIKGEKGLPGMPGKQGRPGQSGKFIYLYLTASDDQLALKVVRSVFNVSKCCCLVQGLNLLTYLVPMQNSIRADNFQCF